MSGPGEIVPHPRMGYGHTARRVVTFTNSPPQHIVRWQQESVDTWYGWTRSRPFNLITDTQRDVTAKSVPRSGQLSRSRPRPRQLLGWGIVSSTAVDEHPYGYIGAGLSYTTSTRCGSRYLLVVHSTRPRGMHLLDRVFQYLDFFNKHWSHSRPSDPAVSPHVSR
eukprot:COSAG05_NODE_17_length_35518_cov_34.728084_20_plen_165_part_00